MWAKLNGQIKEDKLKLLQRLRDLIMKDEDIGLKDIEW
jgi:predicted Rdx family selenoprotein